MDGVHGWSTNLAVAEPSTVKFCYCSTNWMVADMLTKGLPKDNDRWLELLLSSMYLAASEECWNRQDSSYTLARTVLLSVYFMHALFYHSSRD